MKSEYNTLSIWYELINIFKNSFFCFIFSASFSCKSLDKNDIKHCKLYVNTKISSKLIISLNSVFIIVFWVLNLFIKISVYLFFGKFSRIFQISFFIKNISCPLFISPVLSSFKLSINTFIIFSLFSINSLGLF